MHGHGSGPEAPRARLADDGQIFGADILHRARDGADVAGAERANHDYSEIGKHGFCDWNTWSDLSDWNRSAIAFKPFKSFREKSPKTGLPPNWLFGKRAGAVFLDHGAVLGVEFRAVAEVFVHQRSGVLDMFGAEEMA